MATIPESTLLFTSAIPTSASSNNRGLLASLIVIAIFAGTLHYISLLRLTGVLVTAICQVEKKYLDALETGLLSTSDVDTVEILSTLQCKVSSIREASLRSSLSWRETLREFYKGHSFSVIRCISEVRALDTHIEVMKELQLRKGKLYPCSTKGAQVVSPRCHHSPNSVPSQGATVPRM
ncbi:hypothetical protein MVEN_00976400 [Mycena venus]|uniref:Uncharacterized protein n=1 Tax=Mycena venus TaxID=2733690 RepID=A0A8H6YE91_9AGAR|nr:hypothetical protein MVEN_00976400 [Mycena venus]